MHVEIRPLPPSQQHYPSTVSTIRYGQHYLHVLRRGPEGWRFDISICCWQREREKWIYILTLTLITMQSLPGSRVFKLSTQQQFQRLNGHERRTDVAMKCLRNKLKTWKRNMEKYITDGGGLKWRGYMNHFNITRKCSCRVESHQCDGKKKRTWMLIVNYSLQIWHD